MKKKLTIPDMFYIQSHKNKSLMELATLVEADEKLVKKYLDSLPGVRATASDFGPTQVSGGQIDKYARNKGSVACNEAVSIMNDEEVKKNRGT